MNDFLRHCINLCMLPALFLVSAAQAEPFKVGLWELEYETYKGPPLELSSSATDKQCFNGNYLKDMQQALANSARAMGDCEEVSSSIGDAHLTVEYACQVKKGEINIRYSISFDGDELRAKNVSAGTYKGKTGAEETRVTGRFLGSCPQP